MPGAHSHAQPAGPLPRSLPANRLGGSIRLPTLDRTRPPISASVRPAARAAATPARRAVADPPRRLHEPRRVGIVVELAANLANRDFQHAVADVDLRPHVVEELVLADDAAGVARQVVEHAVGLRRQVDGPLPLPQQLGTRIETEGREIQGVFGVHGFTWNFTVALTGLYDSRTTRAYLVCRMPLSCLFSMVRSFVVQFHADASVGDVVWPAVSSTCAPATPCISSRWTTCFVSWRPISRRSRPLARQPAIGGIPAMKAAMPVLHPAGRVVRAPIAFAVRPRRGQRSADARGSAGPAAAEDLRDASVSCRGGGPSGDQERSAGRLVA